MTKANSLQAVLDQAGNRQESVLATPPLNSGSHSPGRAGRKLIAGHFDPRVAKKLKILAAKEGTTIQALLEEALDLLFIQRG